MAETGKMFSESWYRVAELRLALRPHVTVRRQYFRGEPWHVLQDPMTNQFFRMSPASYRFVARLRLDRTVADAWAASLETDADEAPGQEDVIQLLTQLYHANLLLYDGPGDSLRLFERYRKRKQRELQSRLTGIMFARFPLLDPDDFLRRSLPLVSKLIGPVGLAAWCAVVGIALKIVADNGAALLDQGQAVLAPGNLFLLYAAMVLLKALHEFGHGFMCRHFGGEVHVMGVMLMIFTPIPYVDASSSWAFRSRRERILVGAAGMIVEVFVAALAAMVWANTGPGALHSLAYNMMFIASVSTLLFNGNPLLRYDGYYILSDLLDIPNLHTRSREFLRHLVERHAFGWTRGENPARSRREQWTLGLFAVASGVYRLVVFTAIIFFIADQFLLAGLLMAVVCVVSWGVVPLARFVHYLAESPRLERTRLRAIGVTAGVIAVLFGLLDIIPFPHAVKAPGVVKMPGYAVIAAQAEGRIDAVLRASGSVVRPGDELVRMSDPELRFETEAARATLDEARAHLRRAMSAKTADVAPLTTYIASIERRLERLAERGSNLTVRATSAGTWVAPGLELEAGAWRRRGEPLGEIVDAQSPEFTAIVSQQDAARMFGPGVRRVFVRLAGQAGLDIDVKGFDVIPAEQQMLPSAALGWGAGGDVRIRADDPHGLRAAEPFFQLVARMDARDGVAMLHGRSGRICVRLAPEPLLRQWTRQFRQMIQKRYQW
jgi:putative peptide zinc metalloprotease protein